MSSLPLRFLLLSAVALLGLQAQSLSPAGEIHGFILDASGAPLPKTGLTLSHGAIGWVVTSEANEQGRYWFGNLSPGSYRLKASHPKFGSREVEEITVTVGASRVQNIVLTSEPLISVVVEASSPATDPNRTHQSTTIGGSYINDLPIDRRDYLNFATLAPGVTSSESITDAADYRNVSVSRTSGLSFLGNNGRGNSLSIDGGEVDDSGGGVRLTISQEAVREFQVNRASYSAEYGAAGGGTINVVTKSGTNDLHGTVFGFFRDEIFDAADPFAIVLEGASAKRVRPPSSRQQFGASLGGPLRRGRTFYFLAYESLLRDEQNAVSVLTDRSIFEPSTAQEAFLARLPSDSAEPLRELLTAGLTTRSLFETNSGVFPFETSRHLGSVKIDHNPGVSNRLSLRFNSGRANETNPNTFALVGASRGFVSDETEYTTGVNWVRQLDSVVQELRTQYNVSSRNVTTSEPFGPAINVNGFGMFNRDLTLPSRNRSHRIQIVDTISWSSGSHRLKAGGQVLVRHVRSISDVFFGGAFTFGPLPGSVLDSKLAALTLTSVQALNLGLAQTYQQGFGDGGAQGFTPFFGAFLQDKWDVTPRLTAEVGLRYELDQRLDPVPTDHNNLAPRIGFSWSPEASHRTLVRGAYGIFFVPHNFVIDWVARVLGDYGGRRAIAQQFTTLQTPGPANAANIYQTLLSQGVITMPRPSRSLTRTDLEQFGLTFAPEGPRPPFSVFFNIADDYVNSYSQHASFGIEREITPDLKLQATYLYAHSLKIVRPRDVNLLRPPVDERLGIRVWSTEFFVDPLLLARNVYESSGNAVYNAATLEVSRRFTEYFGFDVNYTFSKAIDDVLDFNSNLEANDQTNLSAERALSSFDNRHRVVLYGALHTPRLRGRGFAGALASDWKFIPVVRVQSGQPFNLLVGFDLNQDRHPQTDRPVGAGRNTGRGPATWTLDLRLNRSLRLREGMDLDLIVEGFNILNRLNHRSVNNTVGLISGPFDLSGREDRSPSEPLGFTGALPPRRLQFGVRLTF